MSTSDWGRPDGQEPPPKNNPEGLEPPTGSWQQDQWGTPAEAFSNDAGPQSGPAPSDPYGQQPYGQNPYGQSPYGQGAQSGSTAYGAAPSDPGPSSATPAAPGTYGTAPYGAAPSSTGPSNPYGQNQPTPYGQANPYGQPSPGLAPYGQGPYGQQQGYGQPAAGPSPYGQQPTGPYGAPTTGSATFSNEGPNLSKAPGGTMPPPYQGAPGGWGAAPGAAPSWDNTAALGHRPFYKPGIIPLRPLSVGEIFDGAFQSIRRNPKGTLGTTAAVLGAQFLLVLLFLVPILLVVAASHGEPGAGSVLALFVLVPLAGIVALVLQYVLMGMLTTAVAQAVLGRSTSVRQLWDAARPKIGRLVLASLAVGVAIAIPMGVLLFLGFACIALGPVGVLGLLMFFLAAALVGLYLYTRLCLTVPVIVLEDAPAMAALSRSWKLTAPSVWRLTGILLLFWLIVGVIGSVLNGPGYVFNQFTGFNDATSPGSGLGAGALFVGMIVSLISQTLSQLVTYPLLAAVPTLLYLDTRMRQEGLDITLNEQAQQEMAAQQAGGMPGYGIS